MAEAEPWTTTVPCRYFKLGLCRAGDRCRYAHNHEDDHMANSNVCKYFLIGSCTYANKCRYDHTRAKAPEHSAGKKTPTPVLISSTTSSSPSQTRMVTLRKQGQSSDSGYGEEGPSPTAKEFPKSPLSKDPEQWVQAAEFVPGQPYYGAGPSTYSAAVSGQEEAEVLVGGATKSLSPEDLASMMCPYAAHGDCQYGEECVYIHGEVC
eukprot:UN26863